MMEKLDYIQYSPKLYRWLCQYSNCILREPYSVRQQSLWVEKKEVSLQTLSSSKATVEIKRLYGLPATKPCHHTVPLATAGSLGTEHKHCWVLPDETHSGWNDIRKRALVIHRCHSKLPQKDHTKLEKTAASECLTLTGHLYHSPKARITSGKGGCVGTRDWGRGL